MQKNDVKIKKKSVAHEKLRAAMIGYTQGDIAKLIGIDRSTFSSKINGHGEFTLPECQMIAKLLNKTLDEIFFN